MDNLRVKLTGIAPIIMHNGQLALPTNSFSREMKKISSKRKKVDADYEELAHLEFLGGLYTSDGAVVIPAYVFEGALLGKGGASRKERAGKDAQIAVFVENDAELIYDGPKTPHELWVDGRFDFRMPVKIGQATIERTRPMFKKWSCVFDVRYDLEFVDRDTVVRWLEVAGERVGLCLSLIHI